MSVANRGEEQSLATLRHFSLLSSGSLIFFPVPLTLSLCFSEDDLSSILESLSMSDVAVPVDQSNYREQSLAVRDRFIGATVTRRMFVAKAAPPWLVNVLLEELMTEVMREVVLETVADVSCNSCTRAAGYEVLSAVDFVQAQPSHRCLSVDVSVICSASSRRRRVHCRMPSSRRVRSCCCRRPTKSSQMSVRQCETIGERQPCVLISDACMLSHRMRFMISLVW